MVSIGIIVLISIDSNSYLVAQAPRKPMCPPKARKAAGQRRSGLKKTNDAKKEIKRNELAKNIAKLPDIPVKYEPVSSDIASKPFLRL